MDINLGERLIGESSMGIQRWRKLCSWVKNRNTTSSFRFTASTDLSSTNKEKLRIAIVVSQAAFQFMNGIDGLDRHSQGCQHKEHVEITEEGIDAGSRCYYCHSCDQVVTNTNDEFVGVSSSHHAKLPESKPSASDSNGHGTMKILPPDQIVVDIVAGSTLDVSPLHGHGSHDYENYGHTNQAPGHDESNLSESLLVGGVSDHAPSSNVPGNAVPSSPSSITLLPLSVAGNASPVQPHPGTIIASSAWIFGTTGFSFEAVSAFFDQVSSPKKPHYALYGMLLSIIAILVCTLDLILSALKQRRITSEGNIFWDVSPEIFGLALACIQSISSAVQYSFLCRHAANPLKVSLVPFLFFFVLFAFKYRNGRN